MSELLRISDAASLALHAMLVLAHNPSDKPVTATRIANVLGVSRAHLAKVFQRLAKEGLVLSTRGPSGGFVLARPSNEVLLIEIYEAIEGRVEERRCLLQRPVCGGQCCILGTLFHDLHRDVYEHFKNTRLSEMQPKGI